MSFYRHIIKKALELSWRYKYLWVFGLLAALSGNTGEVGIYFRNVQVLITKPAQWATALNIIDPQTNLLTLGGRYLLLLWQQTINAASYQLISLLIIAGVIVILAIIAVCLIAIGQTALIAAAEKISNQQKFYFSTLLKTGLKYFRKIIVINIIGRAVIYLLIVLLDLPLIYFLSQRNAVWSIVFMLLLLVIILPAGVIVSLILRYGSGYIILKDEPIIRALKHAFELFKRYSWVTLEMALIVLAINFLLGVITVGPVLFLTNEIYDMVNLIPSFWVVLVLDGVAVLAVLAFIGAYVSTFQITSWTLLFLRLTGPLETYSKFSRVFGFLPKSQKAITKLNNGQRAIPAVKIYRTKSNGISNGRRPIRKNSKS